jgi:hypothetical protein
MKTLLIATCAFVLLQGCDVKRKDKIADGVNIDSLKQANALNKPTTVELIDTALNFGTVVEGEKVNLQFKFKNTGNNPLVITGTNVSCGCTVAEKPEEPVMPGQTSVIKVVFNSQNKLGMNHKEVTVNANTNPGFPPLKFSGEVKAKGG